MDDERVITTRELYDDGELDNTIRPESIVEYIGQSDVKDNIKVFIEAAKGDRVAKNILNSSLTYLGIAVANTITNFDPEKVVVGGGVVNGGDIVIETIRKVVEERCMSTFVENCTIEKAVLGGKAGVLGAAALAIIER